MTDRTPAAFMISLTLHALVVAILLLFTYALNERVKETPKIFELVAGEGDNYGAKVAPALGVPGGLKMTVPVPKPEPKPEPAPVAPEPTPIKAAPVKPVPAIPTEKTVPDFAKKIRRQVIVADSKAKQQLAKEHAAEAKQLHAASRKQINDTRALKQQLMVELSNWITEHQLKQADAAQILMVSRPRVSDVVNQKTAKFTIDTLVEMLSRVGKPVRLAVG